ARKAGRRSKRSEVPTSYEFSQEARERAAKVSNIPGPVLRFGRDLDQATISNERRKRFGVGKRVNEVLIRSDDQGWSGDAARFGFGNTRSVSCDRAQQSGGHGNGRSREEPGEREEIVGRVLRQSPRGFACQEQPSGFVSRVRAEKPADLGIRLHVIRRRARDPCRAREDEATNKFRPSDRES